MNSKTAKLISPERVKMLLDCYGANPEAWPDDERLTALALIQNSSELKRSQEEAAKLDRFLIKGDAISRIKDPENPGLMSRIMDSLPEQEMSQATQHSVSRKPFFGAGNWVGMIAASIAVFVISLSIVELHSSSIPQRPSNLVQPELDSWMWEQVTGEVDDEDEEVLTMMVLLDLDEL